MKIYKMLKINIKIAILQMGQLLDIEKTIDMSDKYTDCEKNLAKPEEGVSE